MNCPSCGAGIPAGARFCISCGLGQGGAEEPTLAAPPAGFDAPAARSPGADTSGTGSSASGGSARFATGTVLSGRYRIVSLLGRGGMGEVYRADDLKLDQPVALKFLPEAAGQQGELLERLLAEVRLARQVSHPNVCRVYDVAELGATHFLSMEYIDGEDLGTLLRRIGRLPRDKAGQIARQLCAGLAAAHARGVLHRDFKPSNVMIDGQGNARITDFGLAGLAAGVPAGEAGLGTPAYMAPEQLAGREVSVQSDLYALGLVLYELFTGRRAFRANSAAELVRLQESSPATPSSLVEGLDPAVERAVMRCLERDPAERPRSALAVAAALPGGDPLAAALEAGETPSPEVVAEARAAGGLAPRTAWGGLTLALALVVVAVALAPRTQLTGQVPLPRSTEVLADRAHEITRALGYAVEPVDTMSAFSYDEDYFDWVSEQDAPPGRWDALVMARPSPVYLWQRQSPRHLLPVSRIWPPTFVDPPRTLPGMISLHLDPLGRLVRFEAVPPEHEPASDPAPEPIREPAPEPAWEALFAVAELEPQAFHPVEPSWTPPVWADRRAAWEGALPGSPGVPLRVESAAYRGRPVWFRIIPPWTAPTEPMAAPRGRWAVLAEVLLVAGAVLALAGAALLARRNLRLGRSDRRGAVRLAGYLLAIRLLEWLFGAHHVPTLSELSLFFGSLAAAMWRFGLLWLFYVAIEPYLRRLWPRVLISWVRLLQGRLWDPLVGRHAFVGCLYGLVALQIATLHRLVAGWLGHPPLRPDRLVYFPWELQALSGPRHALADLLQIHDDQVMTLFFGITILVVLRLLLRRTWMSVGAWVVLAAFMFNPGAGRPWLDILVTLLGASLAAAVLFRFGLLSLVVGWTVSSMLAIMPLTFDLTTWHSYTSLLALAAVLALIAWGFHASLAGRPLFADEWADG